MRTEGDARVMARKRPRKLDHVGVDALMQVSKQANSSAAKALRDAVTVGPALEAMRQSVQTMIGTGETARAFLQGIEKQMAAARQPAISIPSVKPREAYILEAQYDTIKAINDLQEQSVDVMSKQIEVLEVLQREAAEQTGLTRWVLRLAIAAVAVACGGIVLSVIAIVT